MALAREPAVRSAPLRAAPPPKAHAPTQVSMVPAEGLLAKKQGLCSPLALCIQGTWNRLMKSFEL